MNRDARIMLVTGGAGFIGSNLVDGLIEKGFHVRVIDNFATAPRENLNPAAELIVADIRKLEEIQPAFAGVDCVFHMAALPRVPLSLAKPVETHMTNVVGTLNVLIAARDAHVRRLIYAGSSSSYGNQNELPFREEMRSNPLNPYALQKLTGEEYVRLFHRLYGMQALTLRYFNVFGPRMTIEGTYKTVIGVFINARRNRQPLPIEGDGEQTRDFTHVRDVVRANILALDCAVADGRTLNIGRGQGVSVNAIANMFGGPAIRMPARIGDARDTSADYSQAAAILGWRPEVSVEEGVRELMLAYGLTS